MSSWDDEPVDEDASRKRGQDKLASAQGRVAAAELLLKAQPPLPPPVVKQALSNLPPLTSKDKMLLRQADERKAAEGRKGGKSRRATKKRSKRKARKTAKK